MNKFEKLYNGKHISVVSDPETQYEFVNEDDIIVVLPVLRVKSKFVKHLTNYYLALRKEYVPPYLAKERRLNNFYYTTITGKMDKDGETPEQTMRRELIEEAGIELIDYTIMSYQKDMPVCKTTDMRAHIYTVLVNEFKAVKAVGDGTVTEEMSKAIFVNLADMEKVLNKPNIDFLLFGGYQILMNVIKNYIRM